MAELVSNNFYARLDSAAVINSPSPYYDEQPSIATLTSGGFVILSRTYDSMWVHLYDSNGDAVGTAIELAPEGFDTGWFPEVTGLANGGFAVTWEGMTPDDNFVGVGVQIFDSSGNPVGDAFTANTTIYQGQQQPSVASLASGGFVIAWTQQEDGSSSGISAQIFDSAGTKVGAEFTVNQDIDGQQYYPRSASLPGGGFVIAWADNSAGTVSAQIFDSSGNTVGNQLDCADLNFVSGVFDIAVLATGQIVIVWPTNAGELAGQVFSSTGVAVGSQFQVNLPTTDAEVFPEIAALPSGEFVVAWREPTDGVNYFQIGNIVAQRFSSTGVKLGEQFSISSNASGESDPNIVNFGTNDLAAAYLHYDVHGTPHLELRLLYSATEGTRRDDVLSGTDGVDFLYGLRGADTISGGGGRDSLYGGLGNDTLSGGAGTDLFGFAVGDGQDIVTDLTAGETVEISGYLAAQSIAQSGANVIVTLSSTDRMTFLNTTVAVVEAALAFPDAAIHGTDVNDTIDGTAGNDTIDGHGGTDTIHGLGGNDIIHGGADYDYLYGDAGDDIIYGEGGYDTIDGGAGNDTIHAGPDGGTFAGGDGNDTFVGTSALNDLVNYGGAAGGVTASLAVTGPQDTGQGLDSFVDIDSLQGSAYGDVLTGNDANNQLHGMDGNDQLFGGAGYDLLSGGAGSDHLDGGTGIDEMHGGAGDDTYVVDDASDEVIEDADQGHDTIFSSVTYSLLNWFYPWIASNVEAVTLTGSGNIDASGDGGANSLTGNSGSNGLYGYSGADVLIGGGGNDTLDGGADSDQMSGGTGDDVYHVDSSGDVLVENSGEGTDLVYSAISFTLGANIENLTLTGAASVNGTGNGLANILNGNSGANSLVGLDGNDTLYGNGGNDVLFGGAGADWMYGGAGNDSYSVDSSGDVAVEAAGEGTDYVYSTVAFTLGANVENLTLLGAAAIDGTGNGLANLIKGNAAANSLAGLDGNDQLYGLGGNDVLFGGAGADWMFGGAGDDSYSVETAGDLAIEAVGEGTDFVYSTITLGLGANVENLTLIGTAAINGTGNALANSVKGNGSANILNGLDGDDTLIGMDGNDILVGGAGTDLMYGGTGNDSYSVDNAADLAIELAGEGTDYVYSTASFTLGANIENLTLNGASAIDGAGNGLANTINGNSAANSLAGMGGNDTLYGKDGNDVLAGGAGTDLLFGGTGSDLFAFDDGDFGGMTPATADMIVDFSQADGDLIDLSQVDADSGQSGDQAFSFIGSGAFTGTAGELRYEQLSGNTYVYGDTNGDGTADFMIRLPSLTSLSSGDFVI